MKEIKSKIDYTDSLCKEQEKKVLKKENEIHPKYTIQKKIKKYRRNKKVGFPEREGRLLGNMSIKKVNLL